VIAILDLFDMEVHDGSGSTSPPSSAPRVPASYPPVPGRSHPKASRCYARSGAPPPQIEQRVALSLRTERPLAEREGIRTLLGMGRALDRSRHRQGLDSPRAAGLPR
jgi:hypothetical protein